MYPFERKREKARAGGRAEGETDSSLSWVGSGSLTWGLIPGPGDHDLSRTQTLNHLNHPSDHASDHPSDIFFFQVTF